MKTPTSLALLALCYGLISAASAADNAAPSAPAAPPASGKKASDSSPTAAPKAPANPALTAEKTAASLEESKATERAVQEHVRPSDPFAMETPPPAPKPESKPASPAPGYVWVPGYWAAMKGEWQWTAGAWSVPATPSSIWIAAMYDEKTKHWSAGYWQPDRPQSTESQPPAKESPTAGSAAY